MCGIIGVLYPENQNTLLQGLHNISHRGPDCSYYKQLNKISLGHARLSILDLSNQANQPFEYLDRYLTVFNGEIYNYIEIRQELEKKGVFFRTQSDTEVLTAAFAAWGEKCLDKFNGMWAFAIWDKKTEKLFLSRDRFGKKPLFYANVRGQFIFASEMKGIYPFLERIEPSSDFEWCSRNLFDYEITEHCLIEGIKRFPKAQYAYVEQGKLNTYPYWNLLDSLHPHNADFSTSSEELRELIHDSVRLRLRSDVPVAIALSGGVDSSILAASVKAVTEQSDTDYRFFVSSLPGSSIDESASAREVADHLKADLETIEVDPVRHLLKLTNYFYLFEELYLTMPIPMIALYEGMAEKGYKVSLDGHGPDEMFSGYGDFLLEAICATDNDREAADIIDTFNGILFATNAEISIQKADYAKTISRYRKHYETYVESKRRQSDLHPNFVSMDYFNRKLLHLHQKSTLPTLLRNYDRYAMINGIESRMPFMDHRVVSYLFSLPWHYKIKNGFTKAILRESFSASLPESIIWKKSKIGFNSPMSDWIKGDLKTFFKDTLHSQDFMESHYIDQQDVRNRFEKLWSNDRPSYLEGENAWQLIAPFYWEESLKYANHLNVAQSKS